jgi:histidinol-phosphate aminotransferase
MTQLKFKKIGIESYKPGKSRIGKMKNLIKLSANESALGISSKVKKLNFNNVTIEKYPDSKCKKLRKQIAQTYACDFNKIICGSGSDEIIQMICQLFLEKNDEVVMPEYSFLMYRIYAKIVGAKIIFSKEKNFKISIDNLISKTTSKTRIVFLANPNNPTGTYLTKNELINLRKRLNKKILLVIDDAYFEYMKKKDYMSGFKLFKKKNNVFILRTFSKVYGLASLRVGWGYGSKKIINELYKIKPPFNVNKVAQLFAIESLKDKKFVIKSIKHNQNWAIRLQKFLNSKNIKTNKISANFFLLDFNTCSCSAKYVVKKLEKKGIILRSMEAYKIKNKLRLTIGSSFENKKFMREMNNIIR